MMNRKWGGSGRGILAERRSSSDTKYEYECRFGDAAKKRCLAPIVRGGGAGYLLSNQIL